MPNSFDAYHQWLGIPPEEQPPNHYRLLGIKVFESDSNVIHNAADRLMMHLRSLSLGPNGPTAQKLLNEVAAARVCLSDPDRQRDYNAKMSSAKQATSDANATSPSMLEQATDTPKARLEHVPVLGATANVRQLPAVRRGPLKPSNGTFEVAKIIVGGLVGLMCAQLILYYCFGVDIFGFRKSVVEKGPQSAIITPNASGSATTLAHGKLPSKQPLDKTRPSSILKKTPQAPLSPPPLPGMSRPANADSERQTFDWKVNSNSRNIVDTFIPINRNASPVEFRPDCVQVGSAGLIAPRRFRSIQSASITLGIPVGSTGGTAIGIGPVSIVLNWEVRDENHFRYCLDNGQNNPATVTTPAALLPDRFQVVTVEEEQGEITVRIDGKEHFHCRGSLSGTVSVTARGQDGTVLLKQIVVVGIPDKDAAITGPVPNNLY